MKKLIAILMVLMVGFAFAGGWSNLFMGTYLTTSTIDDYVRIPCWDETNGNRVELEIGVLDDYYAAINNALYGKLVSLDTATVKEADKADDNTTYSISILSTQFLLLDWLFVESGFDGSEYIEISNADSNGTALDTLHLGTETGRRTNTYFFNPTQDTTLYIVWGDTCNVNKKVVIREMVFSK